MSAPYVYYSDILGMWAVCYGTRTEYFYSESAARQAASGY